MDYPLRWHCWATSQFIIRLYDDLIMIDSDYRVQIIVIVGQVFAARGA